MTCHGCILNIMYICVRIHISHYQSMNYIFVGTFSLQKELHDAHRRAKFGHGAMHSTSCSRPQGTGERLALTLHVSKPQKHIQLIILVPYILKSFPSPSRTAAGQTAQCEVRSARDCITARSTFGVGANRSRFVQLDQCEWLVGFSFA